MLSHNLRGCGRVNGAFVEEPFTPWATSNRGDSMKNTTQVYVLALNAPSRKTVRLWTGASIHSLRYCSSKKIDRTLAEMQHHVDDLQRAITGLATGGSYSINRSR